MEKEKCDRDKAFAMTLKSGPCEFIQRLKKIAKLSNDKGFKENHIVFIDKNHP